MHRTLAYTLALLCVASLAFLGVTLFAPPPRVAHAEGAVFNTYTHQANVASAPGVITVPARVGRFDVVIEQLTSTADAYCGSPQEEVVTTANGMLLPGVKGANLTLHTAAPISCVSVGTTVAVSYQEDF